MKKLINWNEVEALIWSHGNSHQEEDPEVQVLLARIRDNDFRKAEALCEIGGVKGLQELRTNLARGLHELARLRLEEMLKVDDASLSEIWLELSRLDAYEARWCECLESCSKVITAHPSGITHLTALQIRSVALYELGMFDSAIQDIEKIECLAKLYPASASRLYAMVLKIRILHKRGHTTLARTNLNRLWDSEIRQKKLNADRFLALIRTEIDLRKGSAFALNWMLASYSLSEKMGDGLYAALARVELYAAGVLSEQWTSQIEADCARYPRVEKFNAALTLEKPWVTANPAGNIEFTHAVLNTRVAVVVLEPFAVLSLQRSPKLFEAMRVLAQGALSKSDFFSALWGSQKYVPHLHDVLIHQLLFRLRKNLKVSLRFEGDLIFLEGVLVLE